jgi:hypothetical protein
MPYTYRPYPEGHEKAGSYYRAYYPYGVDVESVCARMGWATQPPAGVDVYNDKGVLIKARPAPQPQTKQETAKGRMD